MSAALTDDFLEAVRPPVGVEGMRLRREYERTVQAAMGRCNAADADLVALVQRALVEGWWKDTGCHSPEHWATAVLGVDWPRSRRVVRIARELDDYPETAAQFAAGLLTEAHVFEIVTRVDPARDESIATSAGSWTVAQLRRWSGNFPKPVEAAPEAAPPADEAPVDGDEAPVDGDGPAPDPFDLPPPDATPVRVVPDVITGHWTDERRFVGRFDLGAEAGALFERTLAVARSKAFAERTGADPDDDDAMAGATRITWAMALERVLHAALEGLDPATASGLRPSDRYQVLVHVDAEHPERSRIHLGPLLTKAERQLLTCDADLRAIRWQGGRPIDAGRRQRTVDPILRALIEDRDRGCIVCGAGGFLHIHHVQHWEDGGATDQANLAGICPHDHRRIHAGEIQLQADPLTPGRFAVLDRWGRPLPRPGPIPPTGPPPPAQPYPGPVRGRMPGDDYFALGTKRRFAA